MQADVWHHSCCLILGDKAARTQRLDYCVFFFMLDSLNPLTAHPSPEYPTGEYPHLDYRHLGGTINKLRGFSCRPWGNSNFLSGWNLALEQGNSSYTVISLNQTPPQMSNMLPVWLKQNSLSPWSIPKTIATFNSCKRSSACIPPDYFLALQPYKLSGAPPFAEGKSNADILVESAKEFSLPEFNFFSSLPHAGYCGLSNYCIAVHTGLWPATPSAPCPPQIIIGTKKRGYS